MTAPRKKAAPNLAAKQAEAVHEETVDDEPKFNTFEYKGYTYSVPADPLDVPMEVAYAESEFEIVEAMLGPDQWLQFRKSRPTIRDFGKFSEKVFEAAGHDKGDESGN